jgi:CBS domain-containing protein
MDNKQKPISEIMTRSMCQVSLAQTAIDALARMRSKSVSSVLVVEDGAIRGIITERDIVRAVHNHSNLKTMGCADLMQSPVVSVDPTTPCLDAYHQMAGRGIRHLAVTDQAGKILGLASEGDLMRDFGIEYYMNFKDVGSVMSVDMCLLRETASVGDAVKLMIEKHQSCVLIVDAQQRPIGVVTERDVVRLCGDHMHSERLVLDKVMQSPVKTVRSTGLLHEAVKSMGSANIRRLVVVDDDGAVCGLLTHHEIVRGLEGDYDGYFKALAELQLRRPMHSKPLIDEKLILSTILRSTGGTAVIAADLDFRIGHATPTVVGILGLDPKGIVGSDLREALKSAGIPDAETLIGEAALADGAQTFDAMLGEHKVALRVVLMRDALDRPCGFLVLAQRSVAQ